MELTDEQILEHAGIRITANRLLIWRQLRHNFGDAFSLADIEAKLPTFDRSTIFRTLTQFIDAHLLHVIDDGTGMQKYCVCEHDVVIPENADVLLVVEKALKGILSEGVALLGADPARVKVCVDL